jgi:methylated-DNA-[protein]-cysteine S-methyltransferase
MTKLYDLYFAVIETCKGYTGIVASQNGLKKLILPEPSSAKVNQIVRQIYPSSQRTTASFFGTLPDKVIMYFRGERVTFPDTLDLSDGGDFQRAIWETTRAIPYGITKSYGQIASEAGYPRAARAAGNALGKNPFPVIIPCHRVIAGDGSIGGFTGGLWIKKSLLKLEGCIVK